jgi:hypothetical protein
MVYAGRDGLRRGGGCAVPRGRAVVKKKKEEAPAEAAAAEPAVAEPAAAEQAAAQNAAAQNAAAEPPAADERLPWLQRVEEDDPASRRGNGRVAGYALGGAVLAAAAAALIYAEWSAPQPPRQPSEPALNLAEAGGEGVPPAGVAPVANSERRAARPSHAKAERRGAGAERTAQPARHPAAASQPVRERATGHRDRTRNAAEPAEARPAQRQARPARARAEAPREVRFASGREVVQIGAYKDRAAAEWAWEDASRHARLRGAAHRIERATVHGRVFYRLRVQPGARGCASIRRGARRCFTVTGE